MGAVGGVRARQHWEGDANRFHSERKKGSSSSIESLYLQQLVKDQHQHFITHAREEVEELNIG